MRWRGFHGRAPLSANMRGASFMALSMAGFTTNDALIKLVAGEVPLYQAIFVRGIAVTALLLGFVLATGALRVRPGRGDRRILGIRSLAEIAGTFCFLTALFNMPIANASAILQAVPLAITLAAALFLGEPVGWRRLSAILVGFAGVLIIVRPGTEGFNAFALLVLATLGFIVVRDLSTRRLTPEVPSFLAALIASTALMLTAGLVSLPGGWVPLTGAHVLTLSGSGACLLVGYVFGISAMRVGDVAFVSPFRYTLLLWAMLLGWLLYDEIPDRWMLVGATIVVATGLYTLYRERTLGVAPQA